MTETERMVTAKLPGELVSRLDEIAARLERSKSWIIRQALSEWLSDEQRRYELTLEGISDLDEGRMIDHEELVARVKAGRSPSDKGGRHRPSTDG